MYVWHSLHAHIFRGRELQNNFNTSVSNSTWLEFGHYISADFVHPIFQVFSTQNWQHIFQEPSHQGHTNKVQTSKLDTTLVYANTMNPYHLNITIPDFWPRNDAAHCETRTGNAHPVCHQRQTNMDSILNDIQVHLPRRTAILQYTLRQHYSQ
jgi:hypothetical protein